MKWLRRLLPSDPDTVPLSRSAQAAEVVDELVHMAHLLVRGGYTPRAEIVAHVEDLAVEDGLDPDLFDAQGLVAREIADLKAEQLNWSSQTDWDRLDAAMEALELQGIVARQDFLCCGNCGMDAIVGELDKHDALGGRRARGYVFFHQQDTDSAVEGRGLYFNYGHADDRATDAQHAGIGRELVRALEAAGLEPEWNGSLDRRIAVRLNWQRRWVERRSTPPG